MEVSLVIFDFYRTLYNPETGKENEGASEILSILNCSKIKTCIVSSKELGNENREKLIEQQPFVKFINQVYFIDVNNKEKKYQQAIEDFNCSQSTTLVVGDYLKYDIIPAKEIGCRSIWFRNGKFANTIPENFILPNYTITDLKDVIDIVDFCNRVFL